MIRAYSTDRRHDKRIFWDGDYEVALQCSSQQSVIHAMAVVASHCLNSKYEIESKEHRQTLDFGGT